MNAGKGPKSWLYLHKGEHAGAFYLLVLAVFLALIPGWYTSTKPGKPLIMLSDSQTLAKLRERHLFILDSFYAKNRPKRINLYKASSQDLQSLGLTAENADRIYQKLQSGYKYNSYAQLSSETGLDSAQLSRFFSRSSFKTNNPRNKSAFEIIELNSTDTSELIALPGIGSKTASRIIRFRDALGGFISVNQVLETRGTDSATLLKLLPGFTVNSDMVQKININSCTEEELSKHPYASVREAKLICAFRRQRGNIKADDLFQIKTLSSDRLKKLLPYLAF
jgi:DNA uptake protein ComE-like DNA-binding protein